MYIGTTTTLDADDEFTSGTVQADRTDRIAGSIYADQSGTLFIEQSFDGTNWDISTSYNIDADDGKGFSEEITAPYLRLRFENDGTDQDAFRLFARSSSAGDS